MDGLETYLELLNEDLNSCEKFISTSNVECTHCREDNSQAPPSSLRRRSSGMIVYRLDLDCLPYLPICLAVLRS